MKRQQIGIMLAVLLFTSACAFMMNQDGAYESKDVQKNIKEMGALVDPLKYQNPEKLSYRILADNAAQMVDYSAVMAKKAPDSYYLRMVYTLGDQAGLLKTAAERHNDKSANAAIKEILKTWEIMEKYRKPA